MDCQKYSQNSIQWEFLKNQNWFNLQFVVILNWLTVWLNYFLKAGRTLFLMLFFFFFFFTKLTNMALRSLVSFTILNSVLKGERKGTYLSEQKCLISQKWPSFCINSYLFPAISGRCLWLSSSTENVRILWKMELLPGAILHCRVIDTAVPPAWFFFRKTSSFFCHKPQTKRHLRGSSLAFQVGLDPSLPKQTES